MGHSQLEKQKTHERIVEIASRRLREKGLEGIGVADIMKEAGLTVGGFYKHFESRDQLVAEAMQLAFGSWEANVRAQGKEPKDIPLSAYAATYMSKGHLGGVGEGCPFAALTADLARSGEECRTLATEQMRINLGKMTERIAGEAGPDAEARRKAIIVTSVMAGAVGLARIASDEAFASEILETVEAFVNEFAGK
ncbi:TetR/AcrR family transcriptional regulator [Rhizobium sp. P32RR-XVIII]|uniref:TetR/AcrR family transcriptional regulator n=1 Tax=Rhizobium sp. P32RR-XVIII TaxID=2726738 RepID=UPI0014571697|nr:TetR/AcrR family transcriptional regulator [Rhizobium sp. P32RR-XVIII]NLS03436.1 TetR/AcrR family transcriptional regulator [Rhizobium sp. P32RR-XVIII]